MRVFLFPYPNYVSLSRYNMSRYSANSGRALHNYGDKHVITSINPPLLLLIKYRVSQASNLWSLGVKDDWGDPREIYYDVPHARIQVTQSTKNQVT
jgi:hypothetical protein